MADEKLDQKLEGCCRLHSGNKAVSLLKWLFVPGYSTIEAIDFGKKHGLRGHEMGLISSVAMDTFKLSGYAGLAAELTYNLLSR